MDANQALGAQELPHQFRVPDRGSGNPTPLGGWDRGASGVKWLDGSVQAWQPYGLGLQISPGVGDEVPLPRPWWRRGLRCRELLRETARAHEMVIHAGSVNRDHVHMLMSIPPSLSVSRAVQYLKGRSSHKLLSEFGVLRKRYWGQHLWGRGYWVASSGNVTDDVWVEYIKNQTPPEPDDNFSVT